ncbi:MAG: suppressor of fused domain protein [Deltaproteobacteria bacterium]|nr:suppressor of fused domain protein [Deltaproteobacteria bacterium]
MTVLLKRSLLRDKFIHELTSSEQKIIARAVADVCIHFLRAEKPVYLERFGLLVPRISKAYRSYFSESSQLSRLEWVLSADFHKCSDLTAYHKERYKNVVELKELSSRVYAALPIERTATWSGRFIRHLILGLIETVKHETVSIGYSERLYEIGTFFALHNRQGSTFSDWYAGADIFIKSTLDEAVRCDDSVIHPRAVLQTPSEPFQAIFGAAVQSFALPNLPALSEIPAPKVHVFADDSSGSLIYVTEGIASLSGAGSSGGLPVELTLQLETGQKPLLASSGQHSSREISIPAWPVSAIRQVVEATILKGLPMPPIGAIISAKDIGLGKLPLNSLMITDFHRFHREQLTLEGPVIFRNIVGITSDEARMAQETSPKLLMACLQHKNHLHVTKPERSSIFQRSSFFGSDPRENLPAAISRNVEKAAESAAVNT